VEWATGAEQERLVGEHVGYERLRDGVKHRRSISFDKVDNWWLIEDQLTGKGEHTISARFHFDSGLELTLKDNGLVVSFDPEIGARLLLWALDVNSIPKREEQSTSRHYGEKSPSTTICWSLKMAMPTRFRWALVPVSVEQNEDDRLSLVREVLAVN
jgi:hypothetical protein